MARQLAACGVQQVAQSPRGCSRRAPTVERRACGVNNVALCVCVCVCMCVCLFVCLFVCAFVCLFV